MYYNYIPFNSPLLAELSDFLWLCQLICVFQREITRLPPYLKKYFDEKQETPRPMTLLIKTKTLQYSTWFA